MSVAFKLLLIKFHADQLGLCFGLWSWFPVGSWKSPAGRQLRALEHQQAGRL